MATIDQLNALYQSNLNRPGDADGLGYYANLLTSGVTLSEIDTMMKGSSEYARVHTASPPPPPPPPAPPPPVSTGGVTGATPAPPPAPAPSDSTGGVSTDPAVTPAGQWLPWVSNDTVKIGAGLLLLLVLLSGSSGRRKG